MSSFLKFEQRTIKQQIDSLDRERGELMRRSPDNNDGFIRIQDSIRNREDRLNMINYELSGRKRK